MSEELIRSFICLEVLSEVVKEVARIQEILSKKPFQGKITELENLHLTLKFLGEISEKKVEEVKEELKKISFSSFEAKILETGIFSFRGNPKIVWIKVGGKEIFDLQRKIDEAMLKIGFKPEERFMSHMTIARIKHVKDKKAFREYVENIKTKKISWKVNEFFLKKSELKESGPVYTNLEKFSLT